MNIQDTIGENIASGTVLLDFTIFTPTFNRASTLPILYDSLRLQTYRNFEWVIVDGGSDRTHLLVKEWSQVANFPIRYF
jgi:hypothetical protein